MKAVLHGPGAVPGGNGLRKIRIGRAEKTAREVGGERGRAISASFLGDAEKLISLLALAVFIIRIVMTYIVRCDKALLENMRRTEYVMILILALCCGVYADTVLHMKGRRRDRLKGMLRQVSCPEQWILLGILVWGIVSLFSMNAVYKGNWIAANRYAMEDAAISILFFFPMMLFFEKKEMMRILLFILHLMTAVITVLMAVVIWHVFRGQVINLPDGQVGMYKDSNNIRQLVVSANRNTVGAYAAFTAAMCPVLALSLKNKWARLAYVPAFLVHWTVLCLTQSTTSLVVGALSGALMTASLWLHRGGKGPFAKRAAAAVLIGAAVMILLWMSRVWIMNYYEACVPLSTGESTVRDMGGNSTMSGRLLIWRAAIKAILGNNGTDTTFRNAMFGNTFAGCPAVINKLCGQDMYTHNQYLEMGVCMGIPAMLAYVAFTVFEAIQCFRVCFADRGRVTLAERWITLAVLGLVIANLPEAMLLGNAYMPACFFFILCGYCSRRGRELGRPRWLKKKAHREKQAGA